MGDLPELYFSSSTVEMENRRGCGQGGTAHSLYDGNVHHHYKILRQGGPMYLKFLKYLS